MKKINIMIFLLLLAIISISAVEYAEMYMLDQNTDMITSTLTTSSWQQVTGFKQGITSTNWDTLTTNQLTTSSITGTEKYIVRYSVSFQGSVGDWELGIVVDGATTTPIHTITRRIGDDSDDDVGNASGCGIIELSGTGPHSIKLFYKNPVNAEVFIVQHAQVVIAEVKQDAAGTFGEMYYSAGATHQTKPSGQDISTGWTTITAFNQTQNLSNVTSSSNGLTVGSDGKYLVCLSMSFWGDTGSSYDARIFIGKDEPVKIKLGRYFPGSQDLGDANCFGILDLDANQNISVQAIEANGDNFFLTHGNLSVVKLEGDTDAPYASMGGASSVDILSPNTDVEITTSNLLSDSNFWSFSSNTLSPINFAAGYYLVTYSMSMTYSDTLAESAIYLLTSLHKNSVTQPNLVAQRKLQKRDGPDIGAMGASGIIKIESTNDKLTFNVNDDTGKDIAITKLNIMIQRISTLSDGTLPVELSSFDAVVISSESIGLNWTVQSETNGSCYRIYRHGVNDFNSAELLEDFIPAHNLSQSHTYSFVDENLSGSHTYLFYWLEFVELDNSTQLYGPAMVRFESEGDEVVEAIYTEGIQSAYPNPFNPDVTISYYLSRPKSANFEIYNLKGQLVKVLTTGAKNEGTHKITWSGKDSLGNSVASGTYLIKPVNLLDNTTIKVMLTK